MLKIWDSPRPDHYYSVGCDVGAGHPDGDFSVIEVIDIVTGHQVAELVERVDPTEFALHCVALATLYNEALLLVEAAGHGFVVLNKILNYPNLFCWDDKGEKPGWWPVGKGERARAVVIQEFKSAVHNGQLFINSKEALEEMLSFIRVPGSKIAEAARGAYDDRVIALGIAWQGRKYAMPRDTRPQHLRDLMPHAPRPGEGHGAY